MKKLLAMILALTLTMGITACGSDKTSDKSGKPDKKETTAAAESVSDEEKTETEDSSEEEKVNSITTEGDFLDLAGCKVYDLYSASSAYHVVPATFNYYIYSSTEKNTFI